MALTVAGVAIPWNCGDSDWCDLA